MSRFEADLTEARSRQIRRYGLLISFVFVSALVLTGTLALTRGTSIDVRPTEIYDVGSVKVSSGFAFAVGNVVYSLSSEPVVRVSAPGFRSVDRTIDEGEQGLTITVTLAELPGTINLTTRPASGETRWFLDTEAMAIGQSLELEIPPGLYEVEINNPYFMIKKLEVSVQRATATDRVIDLSPVQGRLLVTSEPTGSTVIVNGRGVGVSPVDVILDGGAYDIEVLQQDYQPVTESVAITNNDAKINRNYQLRPVAAYLTVSAEPTGGLLLIDGRAAEPSQPISVAANTEVVVSYALEGYFPLSRVMTLAAAEDRRVVLQAEPERGSVEITSQPEAIIFVDGIEIGNTPLTIDLLAKPSIVSFRKMGFRTVNREVKPSSKRKILMYEVLQTELAAQVAEAPVRYENTVGSTMLLLQPSNFEMGAPRHEQGQRANEFQRQVEMTLPFYASVNEITHAEFKLFKPNHTSGMNSSEPATNVRWLEAAAFCNWLSQRENLKPFYQLESSGYRGVNRDSNGYRLLTEAEWEWLARRANKQNQTIFSWGDDDVVPPRAGNIADETARGVTRFYVPNYTDGFARAAPVMSFPVEPSGLFDLTGNVREWVHDFYSLQPPSSGEIEKNPLGPSYGDGHVVKGSDWQSGTRSTLRAAYREGAVDAADTIGFRIARFLYGG